jgi:hypothetical protein
MSTLVATDFPVQADCFSLCADPAPSHASTMVDWMCVPRFDAPSVIGSILRTFARSKAFVVVAQNPCEGEAIVARRACAGARG